MHNLSFTPAPALATALAAIVAVLLVVAAVIDGRTRIIPNWLNAAIALLAIPYWYSTGLALWPDVAIQIAIGAAALLVFAGVFAIGQMGGGDVKLITALALFLRPADFVQTLVVMALAGGVLTVVMAVRHKSRNDGTPFENPYGIAIALGGLVAISERYLNHLP